MDLNNIIFMKYGTHANETSDAIIENKINEINTCGRTFWGYSGNICHPLHQVQPFIEENRRRGERTYLVLSRISTVWNGNFSKGVFYSYDNIHWMPIPEDNIVKGSKYALICNSFEQCEFPLDLSFYKLPIGNSAGKLLSEYIHGRITKGCGSLCIPDRIVAAKEQVISAIAEIDSAVFVR